MDKSWMKQSRLSDVYDEGVKRFLDFAFRNLTSDEIIRCPCKKCKLRSLVTREVAYDHLIAIGFLEDYTTWVFHGELESSSAPNNEANSRNRSYMDIDMESLMHEAFGIPSSHETENHMPTGFEDPLNEDQPNPEAATFVSFVKDANKELYPGCENYTKLSFIIQLFHIKCLRGWSNNSFSLLLTLLKVVLPDGESLPNSFYEMKKIIGKLGLGYEKIHACPNDCILYRKEHHDKIECPKCHTSRYVTPEGDSNNSASSELASSKVPAKVLRYFPLIPRLRRLFMSSMTASLMRWHNEDRTKDGYMRHPADSPAWKTFDHKHPDFSAEPRNVRLGLATDGMNPFKTMSTTYSIWPVILMAYNLPPWMCMDRENLFLSMIIPGPSSPGNNIDVYLRPLIDELNLLWGDGVVTFDISTKTNFHMRAALMWTISDLPGLAYVSGWSTRGKYGCICCHKETCSTWLKYGRKFCYMGHRRFLEKSHAFRKDDKSFYGGKENRSAPLPLDGCTILEMLEGVQTEFGKTCANPELPYNWKKKSIFFELPYWKDNLIRHNLDVMHIEKNVCESIIGTLLNLEGKIKDGLNARLDLELMGLKQELHPKRGQNQKTTLPSACYSLKKEEKTSFCKFLKNVKVPDAYAANISRCVNVKDKKIFGMKSHDCHILIQQLLPLAIRGMLSPIVRECLVDLSNFFREIYSKVKMPQDFMHLEKKISNTLCKLEKIFPPAFFDIVVHLLVHLPREAQLAGPVQYRQMYPIERYLLKIKSFVKNRSHPEGSIAEAYLVDECLTFCSRYMKGVDTRLNKPSRNNDDGGIKEGVLHIFSNPGRPLGKGHVKVLDDNTLTKAHRYVLFNCQAVEPYKVEHLGMISQQYPNLRDWDKEKIHNEQFPRWFKDRVSLLDLVENPFREELKVLAQGPQKVFTGYKKYIINGFRFHTKEIEARRRTQNSGVIVTAETHSFSSRKDTNPIVSDVTYYGILTDIVELDYLFGKRVVLFKCDWVSQRGKRSEKDCMLVNFSYLMGDEEPFILASQAMQVIYVKDLKHKDWHIAIRIVPRDFFDMTSRSSTDDVDNYLQSLVLNTIDPEDSNNSTLVRTDVPPVIVDTPQPQASNQGDTEVGDNNIEEEDLLC